LYFKEALWKRIKKILKRILILVKKHR
jgi:hypothetical protein